MSGKLSEDRVRRVKWEIDPLRLAAEYIGADQKSIKGAGRRTVMCCCPVHADRSPSFAIYTDQPDTPYHCHGCGFHGDVITLVREKEDLGFVAAVEWLERWGGIVPGLEGPVPTVRAMPAPEPEDEWTAIMPIPESAMAIRPLRYPVKQEDGTWSQRMPTRVHTYADAQGRPLFLVLRIVDLPSGKVRPLSFCQNTAGEQKWKWLYPSSEQPECAKGRPLYGLDRLAAHPDWPVMICEGEKSADAAARMLEPKGWVVVGSSIGAWNASKTDWSPLAGRVRCLWPDANDPAGAHYAWEVAQQLAAVDHPMDPAAQVDDEDLFS